MSGYNEKGADITSVDFLVKVAEKIGIKGFREYLSSDENSESLRKEE